MKDLSIKIAIVEPAVIIRSGLSVALKRIQGIHIQTFEISTYDLLANYIKIHKPDILIINPTFWGIIDLVKLKDESGQRKLKCIALTHNMLDESFLQDYDEVISMFDSIDTLKTKLKKLLEIKNNEVSIDANVLSQREKEILICVVKGQTNKVIAENLFLSTHTVLTHRRNIIRKLEIHSTAGLTIYAIVNKLVELEDLK